MRVRYLVGFLIFITTAGFLFLFWQIGNVVEFYNPNNSSSTISLSEKIKIINNIVDDEAPQKPLADPPETIKAIYSTGWSAGNESRLNYFIQLIKNSELNAVVIDIKDYSGYVDYDIKLGEVEKYKAKEIKIPKINSLIKRLHDEGIYAIARIAVFQDPVLAKARPDLAIKNKNNGNLWLDNKNLAWIDPASKESWDYNINIAKDAASRGFDEINFDYIRFASDGNLENMSFPFWNGQTPKHKIILEFFKYLRQELPDVKISADLFGLTTIVNDDLGIGQVIEDAFLYFDYISPMVYPSHYQTQFLGYKNPAQYPYEVIKYSMDNAIARLITYNLQLTTTSTATIPTGSSVVSRQSLVKLRPWLQDFDLGADYNAEMVKKEIQAVYDSTSSTPQFINGWMLWSPSNVYTSGALQPN